MASKDEDEKKSDMQSTGGEDGAFAGTGEEGGQAASSLCLEDGLTTATPEETSTANTGPEAQEVDVLGTGEHAPDSQAPATTETPPSGPLTTTTASQPTQHPPTAPFPRTHPLIPTIGHFGTAPQDFGVPFDRATALRLERQRCEAHIMTLQQLMRLWERDGREGRLRRLANELEGIVGVINQLPLRDRDEE